MGGFAAAVDELRHLVPGGSRKRGVVPTSAYFSEVLNVALVLGAPDSGLPRIRSADQVRMDFILIGVALQEIAVIFTGLLHVVLALRLLEVRRRRLLEGVQAIVAGNCNILRAPTKTLSVAVIVSQDGVQLVLARLVLRWRPETHFLYNSQLLIPL